jgi:hypothetical protein
MGVTAHSLAGLLGVVMALAGVCISMYAVKKSYLRDLEDVQGQAFWCDLEQRLNGIQKERTDGGPPHDDRAARG